MEIRSVLQPYVPIAEMLVATFAPDCEAVLHDLAAHNFQNRKAALVQNGSWAPVSGKLMAAELEKMKNITLVGQTVTVPSAVNDAARGELLALADALAASF